MRRRRHRSLLWKRLLRWSKRHRLAMLIGGVAALAMLVGIVAFQEYAPRYSPNTYENALILYDEGNFRAAIIALKSVLKRDRDDLSSRILIGQAYLKIGYAAAAEQELRRARLDGADEAVVNVPLATAYLQQGEYDELFREIPTDVRDPHLRGEFLVLHGKAYVQQRKLDKAEAAFKEAEGLNSDDIEPRLGMARVMLYRGRYAEAEDLADAVTDESPQSAEAWFIKSEVHRARRDFDGALEYYKKATDVDPQHVTARLARAATLIDLGKDERALEDLRQVWAVRPEDPQAYYLYALLLSKSGRMDEAQDMLERAEMALMRSSTDFVLRHPPSLLLLGVIYYQNQKYDKAYDMLDRYVRLEPYHAGARKLLGSILLKRDLGHAAIKMLSPLLDVAPDDPELLMLLSNAYTKSRQPEQAAKLLERAAVLAPTRPEIRTQLALSRLAEGREAEAVDELESALSLGGHSAKAGTLLGLVQLRQGDLDAALDTARTLIERQPDSPAGHNLAGVVHLARHRLLEARKSFERALEIDPSFKTARHNLAKLDIRDGNIDAAKARYREILERDPTDLQSMEELAGFYRDEQRLPEAIQWLEKARAVDPKALGPQFDLMELYLRSGDEAKAKRLVGQLEERFPKSIAVRVARGRVELASGDRSSAASTFRALSHDAADSADRLFRVAKYQLASNDAQGAYGSLEQVLAKDPDFLPAQAAIIELDVRAGRLDSALRRARAIRENRPDLSLGDLLDGDVLMHMGKAREAAQAYAAGLAKEQSSKLAVRYYRARWESGEHDTALSDLEKWVASHAGDRAAQRALGSGYMASGRMDDALTIHERLLADFPEDAAILNNLAILTFKSNDPRSLEFARKAYGFAPKQAATLDTLGWVLVGSGKPGEGLKYLREAHNRAAKDPQIRYHIGAALEKLGRSDEARREVQAALESGRHFDGVEAARALLKKLGG